MVISAWIVSASAASQLSPGPIHAEITVQKRSLLAAVTALCAAAGFIVTSTNASAAPVFKVLAFYNGTFDAAHIDFVKEAREWFPARAAENNFSWESTNDWNRLNSLTPSQFQVV